MAALDLGLTDVKKLYRPLDDEEIAILDRLLEGPFPGRDELREQVKAAYVTLTGCDCGCRSLSFKIGEAPKAFVTDRVPISASGHDSDGGLVGVLLHVIVGVIHELEFYKADGSDFLGSPNAADLVVDQVI